MVNPRERITRPIPERTGPLRSWSALLGGGVARADGDGASVDGVVSRSVEVGYRVVDEYIRHGQRVAERIGDGSLTPGTVMGDFQDLTARMTRYASDLLDVWFQLIELAAAGRTAPAASRTPAAASSPAEAPPAPAPDASVAAARVAVEVVSLQPTEVTLDLRPGSAGPSLVVHALRAAEPDKPRLTDVALEPAGEDGVLRLRVRVPPGQPPGVYNGLVIDERSSRPVGTVSVRVGPAT